MATFEYSGLTSSGRLMTGSIEASSPQQASELLSEMHLTVNEVKLSRSKPKLTAIGTDEFLLFNQQLASITKAGIPLEKGLRGLAHDIQSSHMRKLISEIAADLESGMSIDQAFERHQKNFPPLYGQLLNAGVKSGRLSEMLTSLSRHLEISNQTRRIIFEAIMYPAVVFVLGAVLVSTIFTLVVPQYATILRDMAGDDAQLPALTWAMISAPAAVGPFWLGVLTIVLLFLALRYILGKSPRGRRIKESFILRIPLIGRLYYNSVLARLAESMGLLVSAGTDMPACLRLSAESSGSELLVLDSEILASQVQQGANILEAGQFCKMIPRIFMFSVALGSQRNQLEENLFSLSQMYTQQAYGGQARLQAVLLPVMIILVGGFLGMTVIGLFLPIIKIITVLM